MYPRRHVRDHPAAPLLAEWATTGCPVDCGTNWTTAEITTAIQRGAHPSARVPEAATACREEALARVADGCCHIVNWTDIKHNHPKNLKVSPIAAIPHKSRLYRMILDLSFQLTLPTHTVPSVNATSNKTLAPQHAMFELGRVIPRLIHKMARAPPDHPFLFSKLDLKDGYWRMVVSKTDAWNFAYVLPSTDPTDPPQLVIPHSLQMGWSESPPFFCAATETARDVAETTLTHNTPQPEHPMEHTVMNFPWHTLEHAPPQTISTTLEVYIDDFIAMVQSNDPTHFRTVARHLLHAIDNTFPGPDISGSAMGPAISIKKLELEGRWDTTKEILGWLFDGINRTIQLPPKKQDAILQLLRSVRSATTTRTKTFEVLHGKLQFTSIALPCGRALMGPADRILAQARKKGATKIKTNTAVRTLMTDWIALIKMATTRPTHVRELVLHTPSYTGFVDASHWGAGGVWFSGTAQLEPCVWFVQWPQELATALTSQTNPTGHLTICDLELAGIVLHTMALTAYIRRYNAHLRHRTATIWCDNLAAVHWTDKFRTATSPVAAKLLRALAVHIRHHAAAPLDVRHIPGANNIMADYASRPHPTNPEHFLSSFTTLFPPPQHGYWTLYHYPTSTASKIFSILQMKQSPLASWTRLRARDGAFGTCGPRGWKLTSPPSDPTLTPRDPTKSQCWLPTPMMYGPAESQEVPSRFVPKPSNMRSGPSPRRSNWLANKARWDYRKTPTLKPFSNFWQVMNEATHHRNRASRSPSHYHNTSCASATTRLAQKQKP